ncbi:aromatic acid exporter family protein [Nocardioidaceae bacterium SCSIO 66511]|nr:aromatic acid exporter family protein [Nocardioidaceae bacterium SCSIO 66511]
MASLRDPVTQTDLLQICKAVVAAVLAWVLAVEVFDLAQPFLAPWSALLTVHATVYRTLSEGVQSVSATALGIGLSFIVAQALGMGALTLGATMFLGLLVARTRLLRQGGVTIATTAIFVITTGYVQQESLLLIRLLDTGVGVATGILVNLVVMPPLNDRSAERQVDSIDKQLGSLMSDMAGALGQTWSTEHSQAWIERTRGMDNDLQHAWQLVRHAHESGWWNPRRRWSRRAGDPTQYEQVLRRLEEGIAQTRSMARTINESTESAHEWDARFREPWLDLLAETGERVTDPDADVKAMHERVDALTRELSSEDLPGLLWPIYGALISNLVNIIDIVDDVATARPVRT